MHCVLTVKGAGKSTTVKVLTGIPHPSAAEGAVAEVRFDRVRAGVAAVLAWRGRFGEVRDLRLSEPDLEAVQRGV